MVRALDGVRVVEFCDELGSYAGRLLADLGAEVVKVEPPRGGIERNSGPYIGDQPGPDGIEVHLRELLPELSSAMDGERVVFRLPEP